MSNTIDKARLVVGTTHEAAIGVAVCVNEVVLTEFFKNGLGSIRGIWIYGNKYPARQTAPVVRD